MRHIFLIDSQTSSTTKIDITIFPNSSPVSPFLSPPPPPPDQLSVFSFRDMGGPLWGDPFPDSNSPAKQTNQSKENSHPPPPRTFLRAAEIPGFLHASSSTVFARANKRPSTPSPFPPVRTSHLGEGPGSAPPPP